MLRNKFYIIYVFIILFVSNILSQIDHDTYQRMNRIAKETERKMLALPANEKKINSLILDMVEQMIADDAINSFSGKDISEKYSSKCVRVDEQGRLNVQISLFKDAGKSTLEALMEDLKRNDVEILGSYYPSTDVNWYPEIGCMVPYAEVREISKDERIANINVSPAPVLRPGTAITEGDGQLNAFTARAVHDVDGSGVMIGVISDGIQGFQNSQNSEDLPSYPQFSYLPGHDAIAGSEGRAMCEIVYDLAPGASIKFGSFDYGTHDPTQMISTIGDLEAAGCKVIVDDIGWMQDPWFEDGALAQEITNYINYDNITYISAAGNDGLSMWTGYFHSNGQGWNDYFHEGSTANIQNWITLHDGEEADIYLQWQDTWIDAENNYDLYVYDQWGQRVGQGGTTVQGSGNNEHPFESVTFSNNTGSDLNYSLQVKLVSGIEKPLKLNANPFELTYRYYSNQTHPSEQIYGHPAAYKVISVAAYPASNQNVIEDFSSRGPSVLYNGGSPLQRNTPTITATDGVQTAVPGFNPFYGTSAAAPILPALLPYTMISSERLRLRRISLRH